MEEQSGREFTSADPTAGAQDATLQERGLSPEVPLNPRRRLQHIQRPTPSHVSQIPPRATRRGDDHVARGRRGGLKIRKAQTARALSHGNVTVPSTLLRSPRFEAATTYFASSNSPTLPARVVGPSQSGSILGKGMASRSARV